MYHICLFYSLLVHCFSLCCSPGRSAVDWFPKEQLFLLVLLLHGSYLQPLFFCCVIQFCCDTRYCCCCILRMLLLCYSLPADLPMPMLLPLIVSVIDLFLLLTTAAGFCLLFWVLLTALLLYFYCCSFHLEPLFLWMLWSAAAALFAVVVFWTTTVSGLLHFQTKLCPNF